MKFEIITIFPDFFRGPLDYGIVRRAREAGLIEVAVHDLRAYTHDRHKTVDDRPFGGGEGMVLKAEPIFECVEALGMENKEAHLAHLTARKARGSGAVSRLGPSLAKEASLGMTRPLETVILLSPQGRMFDQGVAEELSHFDRVVMICGRYEGVDERVAEQLADREISVGNFVLSGGELGAAIIVDAVTRLVPGALGNEASSQQESFSSRVEPVSSAEDVPSSTCASGGLLDYPHYTRPAEFRGMEVPEVLSSGNHVEIRKWRRRKALEKTLRNRPDLLEQVELSEEDKKLIAQIREARGG